MLRIRRLIGVSLMAVAALLLTAGLAAASTGALDPTFGNSGTVVTGLGGADGFIHSIAIDGQGRIVAAGYSGNSIAVARYQPDGSLDSTFGSGGIVTTSIPGGVSDIGYSVKLDSTGRIVVAGTSDTGSVTRIAVVRYLASGQLDSSFGTGGEMTTTIGTPMEIFHSVAMTIDSQGRIVVATPSYHGIAAYADFGVIRFTPSGQLDSTFGSGTGKVITALEGTQNHDFDQVDAVTVDSSNRIVVAGAYQNNSNNGDFYTLVRYNTDGTLDSSFGASGVSSIGGTAFGAFVALAIDSQGRIVAAGGPGLARFQTNGSLDPTFGSGGTVTTAAPPYPNSIAIDSSGRIVLAGETVNSGSTDEFALARYQATGAPDTTFGTGGSVTTDIGPSHYSFANSVALDSQGRIVLGGGSYDTLHALNSFALARYLGDATQTQGETLSVAKAGGGLGTVSSSPAGISCGSTCTAGFPQGTQVTLTAVPASPSTFAGWGGACSGTGSCSVTLSSSQSVTAYFLRANPLLLGKAKLNKARGTARIAASVTQSGVLVLAGNGVKRRTIHISGASTINLRIQLTGKLARKLRRTGKVTVTVTITYTTSGGVSQTLSRHVTLVERH